MKELIAFCGLDCENCEARKATIENNKELRVKVAKEWSDLNGVEITPEMINCLGCRASGVKTPFCDHLCPIRQCALKKKVNTCGNCEELDKCGKIKMITSSNKEALERLKASRTAVVYVHGKNGSPKEKEIYASHFPYSEVFGFDYKSSTPWEAKEEFSKYFEEIKKTYESVTVIANSIGAYFTMCSGAGELISKAFFISPVVDMERLIRNMMEWSGVSEEELKEKKTIHTDFGEDLSWEYLTYVRNNPVKWDVPTEILYGENDNLVSIDTITSFSKEHNFSLTVMKDGEHWFHTEAELNYLHDWMTNSISKQKERT